MRRRPVRYSLGHTRRSSMGGPFYTTGSLERLMPSNRRRRCWSPMVQRPDLLQLPAADAHCLNFRRGSTTELEARGSSATWFGNGNANGATSHGVSNEDQENCEQQSKPTNKHYPSLKGPMPKENGLVKKSSSFRDIKKLGGSFCKKDKGKKDSEYGVRWWKGAERDRSSPSRASVQSHGSSSNNISWRKQSVLDDGMLSLIHPMTSAATPNLVNASSITNLYVSDDEEKTTRSDDDLFEERTFSSPVVKRNKKNSGSLARTLKKNPDHGLPYFKRIQETCGPSGSLPGSPILFRRTGQSLSLRSSPVCLTPDVLGGSITPPQSPTLSRQPETLPCSPIKRNKPKFFLSGSPPNSPRGSPPVSPFASHIPGMCSAGGVVGHVSMGLATEYEDLSVDYPFLPHTPIDELCEL